MFKDHPLFSMENVYRAYRQCRRGKRRTVNAMRFERNLEENLVSLHEELSSGLYLPGRSVAFLVEKPKKREIFAADFRDRVVHHILVGHLEPSWERRFIHDSYACRKGKGTHAAVDKVRFFTRKVTANGTRKAWYLQLDVRGYFVTIDRNILFERVSRTERDPAVLWLLKALIFNEPAEKCLLRNASRSDFESLPPHKTLFKAAPHCGLPIGNLTSQFFANVYLDALDQFVKHELKAKYYARYCDDLVLLSARREELEHMEREIEAFARRSLRLKLNDRRRLRPVADGIDFLGYIIRPGYMLVRKRVVGNCRAKLKQLEKKIVKKEHGVDLIQYRPEVALRVNNIISSYWSHLSHASSCRLKDSLVNRYGFIKDFGENINLTRPRRFYSLSVQYDFFRDSIARLCYGRDDTGQFYFDCPPSLIFFRVGNFYAFLGRDIKTAAELFGLNIRGEKVGFPVSSELKYARIACSAGYSVYVIDQRKDINFTYGLLPRTLAGKYLPESPQ